MPLISHIVPPGALLTLLILLPAAAGLLLFALRSTSFRIGLVVFTAWTLAISSLLLFGVGAQERRLIEFAPAATGGLTAETIVAALDMVLLLGLIGIGIARRSLAVTLLAAAQFAAMAWLEGRGGGPHAPEPAFMADWLAIIMVLIISIIGSIVAVYALPYMRDHEAHLELKTTHQPRFFLILLLFLGAMNGLVLSNDLRFLYFFWEVTTLCSFLLIGHDGTEIARANALRALWMNLLGGASFAAGLLLLHTEAHVETVQQTLHYAAGGDGRHLVLLLPMACLCLAGFTKAAQMPFQSWLLGAMEAPTPVSALLHSSTMVKAGVYLIVRFAPVFYQTRLSDMVAIVGGFTFVCGAMLAISQTNAKSGLAYSTISNLGLIIACAGLNTPLALTAAVLLILFHAISKGLLFMAVGVVEQNIHSRNIEDMEGLVVRMPLTTTLMVIGILSMLLPPFGVLIAKLAAIEASVHLLFAMVLMVLGSAFTVVFWTKWMGRLLTAPPITKPLRREPLHSMYAGPLLLLASGALGFSLLIVPIMTRLAAPAVAQYYASTHPGTQGPAFSDSVLNVPWLPISLLLLAAVLAPLWITSRHSSPARGAYLCGEQVGDAASVTFRTVAEQPVELAMGGFYFERLLGESVHLRWITAVASVLVVLVFGATGLGR